MSAKCEKKTPNPLGLRWTNPLRLLFSYARLTMSKIEGNKQANIHAIFATFLTSFFPLPLQATSSSLLWLYFLSWRFNGAQLLFSLCLFLSWIFYSSSSYVYSCFLHVKCRWCRSWSISLLNSSYLKLCYSCFTRHHNIWLCRLYPSFHFFLTIFAKLAACRESFCLSFF